MDIQNLLTFVAVATLLVISPGPNGLLITKTVASSGVKSAFANIWGFVAAFYLHGTLSLLGISVILLQSAQAFFLLKIVGAAYLIWIGVNAIISALSTSNSPQISNVQSRHGTPSIKRSFLEGFLTNALNPKVSMFYLAAFPQFITLGESTLTAYTLITAHALVNFAWFTMMIFALTQIKSLTTTPKFKRWLDSLTGVVFIGFGAKLALMKSE